MSLKDILYPFATWKRAIEKPYTVKRPIADRPGADRYRGFHVNDLEKCIGCGSCEEICQNEAIDLVEVASISVGKGDSGLRPSIDYGRCCWCALCVDVCPTNSLGMSNEYKWTSTDPDTFIFVPGVDDKKWKDADKGYRRTDEAWLLDPELQPMPLMDADIRKHNFEEMAFGYNDEMSIEEASRCLECGLCVEACPAHMDIPEYIRTIRENKLEEGLEILYDTNPFSESCGRICTAHCQDVCALAHNGEAIPIRWLKRYITDATADRKSEILQISKEITQSGKSVAVIGGGPSGLTAAYYLRNFGHEVTVFDKNKALGGMLRYGIPEYRLPEKVLDREIQFILDCGVKAELNIDVGDDLSFEKLQKEYDVVYLSIGAQRGTSMPIHGIFSKGVHVGIEFLDKVAAGTQDCPGKRVIVVGGGNTAMDVCRSALRLGSEEVHVYYRRTEAEMPANREEYEEAVDEGIQFHFLASPIQIDEVETGLKVEVQRAELGEPDESGRRRPVPVEGSEFTVEADALILAIGQRVDPKLTNETDIEITRWGTYSINENSMATSLSGIFAGGDCQSGPDDAIGAIADGKKAAYHINQYLNK